MKLSKLPTLPALATLQRLATLNKLRTLHALPIFFVTPVRPRFIVAASPARRSFRIVRAVYRRR
jgi:hypothetical protein